MEYADQQKLRNKELHAELLKVGRELETTQAHQLEVEIISGIIAVFDYYQVSNARIYQMAVDLIPDGQTYVSTIRNMKFEPHMNPMYKIFDWLGFMYDGACVIGEDDDELVFNAPFNYRADKWEEIGNGKEFRVVGKVQDFDNGEPIPGVNIIYGENGEGLVSDIQGLFALFLKKGDYVLKVSFIGYLSQEIPITVQGNGNFRILLVEESVQLEEVVVKAKKADANVKSTDLGKNTLSMETIEALPPFVGEVDVLKSITLLPGVSTIGEASSGFNVRGGGGDQNLILLGGATLYNPSHLFGFFSSFNSSTITLTPFLTHSNIYPSCMVTFEGDQEKA